MARETRINLALALALLAAPLAAAALGEPFYVNLGARIAILALAGVGLNLALGAGGMVSLGHAAFFGAGGYVAGIAAHHALNGGVVIGWPVAIGGATSMPAIWAAAMLLSALLGALIGALSLRTSGVYFIMITLAFAQMVYFLAISIPTYGGEDGLPIYVRNRFPGLDTYDAATFFLLAYALLMAALFAVWRLGGSRFGAALTAARLSEVRLATAGVSPYPVKLAAFAVSAAIAGLAGALFADLNGFVGPSMLSWQRSGEMIVFVILGGVGRLFGPVAGAALFVLMEVLIGGASEYWQFFLGVILLGVVLYARGGVIGLLAGRAGHD